MKYTGKLFGQIGRTRGYFDTGKTSGDWDALEARAERAEAELAVERARLDWLEGNAGDIPRYKSRSWIWIAHQNLREKIDAAMKEGAK